MRKAIRESKTRTSWVSPNEVYEAGVEAFVAACFADADFVTQVARMAQALKPAGEINTLAQTLLALTSPGVPDLYQGAELFTFDLVDPDNRRAVDWPRRAAFLAEASTASAAHALARGDLAKMMLIERTLSLRRRRPAAFDGRYEPLLTDVDHLVAYQRGEEVIAIAPRLTNGAPHTVHATLRLPAGHWANVLTKETLAGSRLDIGAQLARFPVALLERTGGPS
jgi:(1->4)-alpha-D-glucan 1-alpha-D-glucosylmutase